MTDEILDKLEYCMSLCEKSFLNRYGDENSSIEAIGYTYIQLSEIVAEFRPEKFRPNN